MKAALHVIGACLAFGLVLQAPAPADLTPEQQQEMLATIRTLRMQDRQDAALQMCATILDADANCAQAYSERGIVYLDQQRYSEAETEFTVAVAIDPALIQAYVGRARARASLDNDSGMRTDVNRAAALCGKALEENQRDADAYYYRGVAWRIIGEEADAAWDLTRAVEIRPDFAEARLERAHIYVGQHKFGLAIEHCSEAIKERPDYVQAWLTRAEAYYWSQDYKSATDDCTSALAVNPDSYRAHYNRGLVYGKAGDSASAIADFTRATELRPDSAEAWFFLGEAEFQHGDKDAARTAWAKAVEVGPTTATGKSAARRLRETEPGQT